MQITVAVSFSLAEKAAFHASSKNLQNFVIFSIFLRFKTKWPTEAIVIASKAAPHLVVVRVCISQSNCVRVNVNNVSEGISQCTIFRTCCI